MFSFLNLPARVINILEANITPREIAFGVCLGMFLGFTPLNGTTALLLALFFFIFKVNRAATLLTLPLFKILYLLGISKIGDASGSYLLEKASYLTGFWRLVTNFPIIAYLDVNRTTVAGGLLLSAVLSAPVYFIAKGISAPLLAKYSAKMQNTAFAKWANKFKLVSRAGSIIGSNVFTTMGNATVTVKQTVISKIKKAIIKPKPPKTKIGIMKRLNVTGIAIIVVALIVIQVGVGLIISPIVSAFIIDNLNKSGGAKITVERINVWPLTLSFSMKELKIFDPKSPDKRIIGVSSAAVHLSPLALLSKRLVFSEIKMKGAELDLVGASDGTYNIQHLAAAAPAAGKAQSAPPDIMSLWRGAQEKRDLFGKIYGAIQKHFSKAGQEKAKADRKDSKKVMRVTKDLPKGKLVNFKTPSDMYLFEIKDLVVDGRVSIVPSNGQPVELKDARISLKRVAFDPQNGTRLDGINIRGELFKDNAAAGKLEFLFSKSYTGRGQTAVARAELTNVDLDAARFVYEDSLPVRVVKGRISLSSKTNITGNAINSKNSMTLTNQALEPKQGGAAVVGFIPIAAVCDALNRIDPVRLKFDITGTVEKPEFGGFQETLLGLIKPYIANIGEQVKTQGINALGQMLQKNTGAGTNAPASSGTSGANTGAQQAVDSLKSLFGNKDKQ